MFEADIEEGTLPNGARYAFAHVPNARFMNAQIAFKVGSCDEQKNQNGIAHFVEHVVANHGPKFGRKSLKDYFSWEYGINSGAWTSDSITNYHFKGLIEHGHHYFSYYKNIFQEEKFDPDIVNRERSRIISEFDGDEDDMNRQNYKFMKRVIFGNNAYTTSVLGQKDIVGRLTPEELHHFYREQYNPRKAIMIATGNINHSQLLEGYTSMTDSLKSTTSLTPHQYPVPINNYGMEQNDRSKVVYSSVIFQENNRDVAYNIEKMSMYRVLMNHVYQESMNSGSHYHVGTKVNIFPPYRFADFSLVTSPERAQESVVKLIHTINSLSSDHVIENIPKIHNNELKEEMAQQEDYFWRNDKMFNDICFYNRVLSRDETDYRHFINKDRVPQVMESYRQSMGQIPIVTFYGNVKDAKLPDNNQWVIDAMRGPK